MTFSWEVTCLYRTKYWFLTSFFILASNNIEAKIYKWTDDNGKVHYSDKPFNEQSKELKINDKISSKRQKEARAQARALFVHQQKQQIKQKELDKACYEAKDKLGLLQIQVRVYELDEKGKRKFISDDERKKEIKILKQTISEYCNN